MRKAIMLLILFQLACYKVVLSQPEPPIIQFVEAQPVWEHLTSDTSFYEVIFQPHINKYTVVRPYKSFRFGNDLFLLHACSRFNGEAWGYILEKLNIKTGEVVWQHYSTYYNNNFQDLYKNLYVRPDGDLEMIGVKRHGLPLPDSLFFTWNNGGGKSNFVRKIIDYENGNLINAIVSTDSLGDIIPGVFKFYPIEFDSSYLFAQQVGKYFGQDVIFGYDFFKLGPDHNVIDTLSYSQIVYETSELSNVFTYANLPFIEYLDDTTMIYLVFRDKLHPPNTTAQLLWIDVKDLNNIHVRKRMNVEHLIPGNTDNFLYFQYTVQNKTIYISQPYYDAQVQDYTCYLTVLDEDGNIKNFLQKAIDGSTVYDGLHIMYSGYNYDYYAGFPSKTGRPGFDVLKLFHNSDSLHYISSLTSAVADEEFTRQMEVSKLYDDGIVIIGAYTKKEHPIQNSAVKYYAFNAADLGMEISTSVAEHTSVTLKVFPNPAGGNVNFAFSESTSGAVLLYDLSGRILAEKVFTDERMVNTCFESIPSGLYIYRINDTKRELLHIGKITMIK